jgi:hypothetical protein
VNFKLKRAETPAELPDANVPAIMTSNHLEEAGIYFQEERYADAIV